MNRLEKLVNMYRNGREKAKIERGRVSYRIQIDQDNVSMGWAREAFLDHQTRLDLISRPQGILERVIFNLGYSVKQMGNKFHDMEYKLTGYMYIE